MKTLGPLDRFEQTLLDCILRNIRGRGYPPSVRDLARTTTRSVGHVWNTLQSIRAKGWIDVDADRSRAIRLVAGTRCRCCDGLGRVLGPRPRGVSGGTPEG